MVQPSARRLLRRSPLILLLAVVLAPLAGCKRYYRITDRETGDQYYTEHINKKDLEYSGVVNFVDGATGAVITLDDYELRKIGLRAFRQGVREGDSD
jgi:hypothetical protein